MPPASKIDLLPAQVRDELNEMLVNNAFSNLAFMAQWLEEKGYEISLATVGRHSLKLKESMSKAMEKARLRLETAKALGGLSDGDKAALLESNEMMAMDALMDQWDQWADVQVEDRPKALASLIRAGADLSRSSVGTSKWRAENEARIKRQTLEEAATRIDEAAAEKGLDADAARFWREKVLMGI